ncbi:MAG: CAP domain-containing protein [Bacteroidales bacterium]
MLKKVFLFLLFYGFGWIWAQQGHPLHLQNFDGFTFEEYLKYLHDDGWQVDSINNLQEAHYLSDHEKMMVLAMNLLRSDPARFSMLYVYPRFQYFEGTLFRFPGRTPTRTREGIEALRELYLLLLEAEPRPLLKPSPGLSRAAKGHANYMKNTGYAGHDGNGGIAQRISRQGRWSGGVAENLIWSVSNPHDAIVELLIDDGVRGRGHRINILNPAYLYVGVAAEPHPRLARSYVTNFAVSFTEK